MVSFLGFVMIT